MFGGKTKVEKRITTWNEIMKLLLPRLIVEESEGKMMKTLNDWYLQEKTLGQYEDSAISQGSLSQIVVQLRALGLITPSIRRRSLHQSNIHFWTLTPYGNTVMTRFCAIRKNPQI